MKFAGLQTWTQPPWGWIALRRITQDRCKAPTLGYKTLPFWGNAHVPEPHGELCVYSREALTRWGRRNAHACVRRGIESAQRGSELLRHWIPHAMPQRGIDLQPRVGPSAGQPWVAESDNHLTLKGLSP